MMHKKCNTNCKTNSFFKSAKNEVDYNKYDLRSV